MEVSDFLKEILIKQYGEEFYDKILAGYGSKRPVTLRVNTLKSSVEEVLGILDANKIKYHGVNWSELAYVLSDISEEEIKALDIYQEGKIYLQNLSSQLPPIVLAPKAGESILDMAAAPGGKTTQIAAITQRKKHPSLFNSLFISLCSTYYHIFRNINSFNHNARVLRKFFF